VGAVKRMESALLQREREKGRKDVRKKEKEKEIGKRGK